MGFSGFDTTKGKKVKGNDVGDVHVIVKRKYRQYMNRKGGFNRPLDFVHWVYLLPHFCFINQLFVLYVKMIIVLVYKTIWHEK